MRACEVKRTFCTTKQIIKGNGHLHYKSLQINSNYINVSDWKKEKQIYSTVDKDKLYKSYYSIVFSSQYPLDRWSNMMCYNILKQ